MGAYDIDAATVGRIITDTESILLQNESLYTDLQDRIDGVETAMGSSPVLSTFPPLPARPRATRRSTHCPHLMQSRLKQLPSRHHAEGGA